MPSDAKASNVELYSALIRYNPAAGDSGAALPHETRVSMVHATGVLRLRAFGLPPEAFVLRSFRDSEASAN